MNGIIEKTFYVIFGAVIGTVVGLVILSFNFNILENNEELCLIILFSIIGVLVTTIIIYYNREKLSDESNKIRNETIALMTHEMRTALTSTSWSVSMILKNYGSYITPTDTKMLEGIKKSIHTTVMHTVNLLDVSQLDIGKLSISLEWVTLLEVAEIMTETVEKYKIGAENMGITLVSNINLNRKEQVEVDIFRLRVMLENLLENAIQYSKSNIENDFKKEIRVDINNTASSLNIIVKDNGIGIPKGEQVKIFGEFYRASNARKKLSSGSGIGLHMCAEYVKAHRGTIRFESSEDVGSTFFITIPLKTVADPKEFLEKI